ncbi:MAG: rhodanese-like domain-containing protein [Candidatus Poribacteria bacterium]|nr:rhodanese-like domain-containing protein [Candidatus Poribacteria bacterium]MDE0503532.1 rhodanese-like domain-containing protein [Candidatus Poribacteria bacterium]
MDEYKGYANPQLLISPKTQIDRLGDESICIVDTRPTHEYAAGHIPGAIHLDLYSLSLNDTSERPFKAFMWTIAYLLRQRGVDPNKTIIWYEDVSGICSARGFWFCEYLGHEGVHVLDGGFNAYVAAGGRVSTQADEPPEVDAFPENTKPHTHLDADSIQELLGDADFVVLDTRTDDEHYGRVARSARGGAIPGSIHIEWRNNLDDSGAFKPAVQLRELYQSAGITPEKRVMCY